MKRISLEHLLKTCKGKDYHSQYKEIIEKIQKNEIRPVKASSLNGKKPALHLSYWIIEEDEEERELEEELKFHLPVAISNDYYRKNLKTYKTEREWVKLLGAYLESQSGQTKISLNERSFQIWGQEKFLQKGQGKKILNHCNVPLENLNVYETTEPLAYYSANRQVPQTILVIENKDTFYSCRRFLMDNPQTVKSIFGEEIHTLVYGAGKGILRSIEDFQFCVEPYMNDTRNEYLYFGDLDYEGIGIYERLAVLFQKEHEIKPFVQAYEKMLEKGKQLNFQLPDTKEGQNQNLKGDFFTYFSKDTVKEMELILQKGKYIPQEILNITDF